MNVYEALKTIKPGQEIWGHVPGVDAEVMIYYYPVGSTEPKSKGFVGVEFADTVVIKGGKPITTPDSEKKVATKKSLSNDKNDNGRMAKPAKMLSDEEIEKKVRAIIKATEALLEKEGLANRVQIGCLAVPIGKAERVVRHLGGRVIKSGKPKAPAANDWDKYSNNR